jgi:hypothetical protein
MTKADQQKQLEAAGWTVEIKDIDPKHFSIRASKSEDRLAEVTLAGCGLKTVKPRTLDEIWNAVLKFADEIDGLRDA